MAVGEGVNVGAMGVAVEVGGTIAGTMVAVAVGGTVVGTAVAVAAIVAVGAIVGVEVGSVETGAQAEMKRRTKARMIPGINLSFNRDPS